MEVSRMPFTNVSQANIIDEIKKELRNTYVDVKLGVVSLKTAKVIKFDKVPEFSNVTYEINENKITKFMTGVEKVLLGKNYSEKNFELVVKINNIPVYTTDLSVNDFNYGTNEEIETKIKQTLKIKGDYYKDFCTYLYYEINKVILESTIKQKQQPQPQTKRSIVKDKIYPDILPRRQNGGEDN